MNFTAAWIEDAENARCAICCKTARARPSIGTGRGWSVRELVDIARKVTGRDIPMRVGPRRLGDPPALVSGPALAQARQGWSPRYADIAVQMAHAWGWRQGGRGAFQRARAATSG